MKKIFAMLLAIAMLIGFTPIYCFAADDGATMDEATTKSLYPFAMTAGVDPDADYEFGGEHAAISVTVSWKNVDFVYDFGNIWDGDTHAYVSQPGWNYDYATVEVRNNSNCPLGIIAEFDKNADPVFNAVRAEFDEDYYTLESAVGKAAGSEDYKTFILRVSGAPTDAVEENKDLGTISIFIGAPIIPEEEAPVVTAVEPEEEVVEEHVHHFEGLASQSWCKCTGCDLEVLHNYVLDVNHKFVCEYCGVEHEHHYVYDTFGRLVCTICNDIAHTDCIDLDEDGICDECGLERDFCEDCHYGGTCHCI